MNLPDTLPTLSAGAHKEGSGQACVMEYVSLLAGEKWSDSPSCTHPMLAQMARAVNDRLSKEERHRLVPLIGRLFGTREIGSVTERRVLRVQLSCWCVEKVLPLATKALPSDIASRFRDSRQNVAWAVIHTGRAHGDLVALLADFLDEYDRLTGRTVHREITTAEWDLLASVAH